MKMTAYQTINGTSYNLRTPDAVTQVLETCRLNHTRLHISIGETEGSDAGLDWMEEFDNYGFIGRSTGTIKIPLLVHNSRSLGGGGLLDHCIVRIRTSSGGRVLYQHPTYHHGTIEIQYKSEPVKLADGRVLTVDVLQNGVIHASFESIERAQRWVHKLGVSVLMATTTGLPTFSKYQGSDESDKKLVHCGESESSAPSSESTIHGVKE